MREPTSIAELDLTPIPGKKYWNSDREWREEFIYFIMVDRFHDSLDRAPVLKSDRSKGSGNSEQLGKFCGGTLEGITNHLDYIKNLGCTAIWLSPIFENNDVPNSNSDKYHGYAIQNYLRIDPRFGSKQDLIDLVFAAHIRNMRVFLDAVVNHSGDNWYFNNDDDPDGLILQDILIKSYCYWMREADIDGFRINAVKHMGEVAVARFCSSIREYAYRLGKRDFFLFGELVAGDDAINRYIGPNTSTKVDNKTVYFGLNSVLDFPLYWSLPGVIKGFSSPMNLINRYEALRNHALTRGELGRYLVTFIDNHDQIGQDYKRRFAADTPDEQVIAAIGYLLCAIGTPCIYYGTEQGFSGKGKDNKFIREAAFDLDNPEVNYLNRNCIIYQEIAKIAKLFHKIAALRFGCMYFREISGNGCDFGLPQGQPCTLAFSRILAGEEVLIAYNTSTTELRNDFVIVDSDIHNKLSHNMKFLYGKQGTVPVQKHPDNESRFIQLALEPMQFVILQ